MAGVHIAEALRMLLPYAICASRTVIFLQTSHISGPLPCPGQSIFSPIMNGLSENLTYGP
jgi:hypothetical protein